MEDNELAQLRAARMAQMQNQYGNVPGGMDAEAMQREQQKQAEAEARREAILSQIMTPEARERLSRVRIVKGEKAKKVEDMLINMATKGQLQEVVDENGIKKLLEQMSEVSAAPKVAIRRRAFDDDDW